MHGHGQVNAEVNVLRRCKPDGRTQHRPEQSQAIAHNLHCSRLPLNKQTAHPQNCTFAQTCNFHAQRSVAQSRQKRAGSSSASSQQRTWASKTSVILRLMTCIRVLERWHCQAGADAVASAVAKATYKTSKRKNGIGHATASATANERVSCD